MKNPWKTIAIIAIIILAIVLFGIKSDKEEALKYEAEDDSYYEKYSEGYEDGYKAASDYYYNEDYDDGKGETVGDAYDNGYYAAIEEAAYIVSHYGDKYGVDEEVIDQIRDIITDCDP